MFRELHDRIFDEIGVAKLPPWRRLLAHKLVIREAARQTRNNMLETSGESGYGLNITLTSAARAIARNDSRLASVLIASSPTIAKYVSVSSATGVLLHDPVGFQAAAEESKRAYYDELRLNLERERHDDKDRTLESI